MKIEIEHLIKDWQEIKHQWFDALRNNDEGRMKYLQKRMNELESKIRIHTDTMSDDEKQLVDWQVRPSNVWTKFAISHHFHRDL